VLRRRVTVDVRCVQEIRRFSIRVKGVEFLEMDERCISFSGQGKRRKREVVKGEEGQDRSWNNVERRPGKGRSGDTKYVIKIN